MSSKRPICDDDKKCIREWLEQVTLIPFPDPNNFHASLKDGVILCELIVKLRGLKYGNYQKEVNGTSFKEMENIAFFIQNVQKIGLKCEWTIRALHKNSDLNSVLKTVIDLSKHFETKFRNSNAVQSKNSEEELFTGPFLKLPIVFKQPSNATVEVNAAVPMWKSALRKTTSGVKLTSTENESSSTTTSEEKPSTPTDKSPTQTISPVEKQPTPVEVKPEIKSTTASTTTNNNNTTSTTTTATSSKTTATTATSGKQPASLVVEKKVEPIKDVKTTPTSTTATTATATATNKEVTKTPVVTNEIKPTTDKKTTVPNTGTSASSTGNSSPREKIADKSSPTSNTVPSKAILKPTNKTGTTATTASQPTDKVPEEWTKLKPTNSGTNLKEAAEKQPEFLTNRLRPVSVKMNTSPLSESLKNDNSSGKETTATVPIVEKQPITKVEPVKDVKPTPTKEEKPVATKEVIPTPVKEEKPVPQKTATPPKEITPGKKEPQEVSSPNTGVSYLSNLKSTHNTTGKNVSTPTTNEVPNFKAQLKPVAKTTEPSTSTPTSATATTGGSIFPVQLKKTNIPLSSLENKEANSPSGTGALTKTNSGFSSPRSDAGSTNTSQYVASESTADSLSEDGSSVMDFDEDEEDMSNDQGIAYNIKKLKDQVTNQHPSSEYLYSLYKLFEKKSVKWCTKFSDQEGGVKYLGQIITTMNEKKYRSMNEKTVQERSLKCCHALIEKGIFDPFLKNPTSVSAITFMIDSKDGIKIRIMALEILSLICTYNEQGFWTVLEGLNRYKTEKKEPRRFRDLIEFLKVEKDEKLKTFCLMLLNSLINTPQDSFIRILIRNELKQLGLETVVDKLSNELQHDRIKDENLKEQIKVFEEEMMIGLIEKEQAGVSDDSENTTENLFKNFKSETDPLKIVKLLILRLGATTGTSHLVTILQNLLSYSMSASMDPKFEPQILTSWKNLDSTIKSMVQACQMKGDGGIIEDIAKKEKNASFEKQKQTSKISNLNLAIEKANKEIDELKKQVENWKVKFNDSSKNISILSNQLNNLQINKDNNAQPNDVKSEPIQQIIPIDTQVFTKEIDELKLLMKEKEDSVENVNKENEKLKDQLKELLSELEEHRKMSFKQSLQTTTGTIRSNSINSSVSDVNNQNTTASVMDQSSEPSFTTPVSSGFVPPPPTAGSGFVPPPPGGSSSSIPNVPQVPNMTSGTGFLPPPPPSGIVATSKKNPLPELSKRAPKSAVKNFYGVAINRHKVSQTCWVKGGIAADSKEVPIDEDELEDLFSNAPKKNVTDEEKKKRKELISFVEPQKGSALSILLGYIRLDYSEIRRAILEMDEEVLTAQVVDTLKDKMATADELSQIEAYSGDPDLLSPVDKFYLALKDVPRLEGRLFCWAFRFKFQTEVSEVLSDLETVLTASTQVVQSSRFKKLLAVILAIANFLNANSSTKKNAYGFTLNSLSKLQDTKSADNKSSLLQYISSYCEKSFPDLLNIKEDFSSLEDATRVSLVESDNEYRKLKQGFETMERELQNEIWESTTFKNNMGEFMESATRFLDDIDSILSKIDEKLKQISEDFAEDEKTICKNPNELFQTLNNFLNNFRTGYEELVKQREADEKKKLKQKIMEEKKKQSAAFFSNHTNMMKLKKMKANDALKSSTITNVQQQSNTTSQDSVVPSSPPPPPPINSESSSSSTESTSVVELSNPPTINTESTSNPTTEITTPVTETSTTPQENSDVMSEAEHLELLSKMRDRKKSIMSGSAFRERRMTRLSAMENNEQQQ